MLSIVFHLLKLIFVSWSAPRPVKDLPHPRSLFKGLQALTLSSRFIKGKNPEWVCFGSGAEVELNMKIPKWLVSATACWGQEVKRGISFNGNWYSTTRIWVWYLIQLSPPFIQASILIPSHLRTRICRLISLLCITTKQNWLCTMHVFWDHASTIGLSLPPLQFQTFQFFNHEGFYTVAP